MEKIILSAEQYNRLYKEVTEHWLHESNAMAIEILDENICLVSGYEEKTIIQINIDSEAGKILSNYAECLFRININDDGNIYLSPYCHYCIEEIDCKLSWDMDKRNEIEKILFIDPFPDRNKKFVDELEELQNRLHRIQDYVPMLSKDTKVNYIKDMIITLEEKVKTSKNITLKMD